MRPTSFSSSLASSGTSYRTSGLLEGGLRCCGREEVSFVVLDYAIESLHHSALHRVLRAGLGDKEQQGVEPHRCGLDEQTCVQDEEVNVRSEFWFIATALVFLCLIAMLSLGFALGWAIAADPHIGRSVLAAQSRNARNSPMECNFSNIVTEVCWHTLLPRRSQMIGGSQSKAIASIAPSSARQVSPSCAQAGFFNPLAGGIEATSTIAAARS